MSKHSDLPDNLNSQEPDEDEAVKNQLKNLVNLSSQASKEQTPAQSQNFSQKKKFLWINVKKQVKEWSGSCTTHGIFGIINSDYLILRIIWICVTLASFAYCLYTIINTLLDYLSNPVITNVEIIDELPTEFPTIMLCNLNPFRTSNASVAALFKNWTHSYSSISPSTNLLQTSLTIKSFLSASLSVIDVKLYGYELKDMLIKCRFNYATCSISDFEWVYTFDYINCYKFNANGSLQTGKTGADYGLQVELYVGNSSWSDDYVENRGIRYLVYNYTTSNPFIADQGYDAAPGFVSNVQIDKRFISKLSHPYSSCVDDLTSANKYKTELMRIMFDELNQTQYSQIYCQNLCLQRALILNCNCIHYALPVYFFGKNASIISSEEQITCFFTLYNKFVSDPTAYCGKDCERECEYAQFRTTVSMSEYLTPWYWSISQEYFKSYVTTSTDQNSLATQSLYNTIAEMNLDEARESTLRLNFYYTTLGYEKVSESPFYTAESVLSAIGGQLGLFCGMSLISLVEFMELICLLSLLITKFWCSKYKTRRLHP